MLQVKLQQQRGRGPAPSPGLHADREALVETRPERRKLSSKLGKKEKGSVQLSPEHHPKQLCLPQDLI